MRTGDRVLIQVNSREPQYGTICKPFASRKHPHCATVKIDGKKQRHTFSRSFLTVVEQSKAPWLPPYSEIVVWAKNCKPPI